MRVTLTVDFQKHHFADPSSHLVLGFTEVITLAVFRDVQELQRTVPIEVHFGFVEELLVFAGVGGCNMSDKSNP